MKEPKGEPETLWGKMGGQMGDRVSFAKPTELMAKMDLKRKSTGDKDNSNEAAVVPKRSKGGPSDILAATEALDGRYRPRTRENRAVYEQLLSFVQMYIGDQPHDVVTGAVDEILGVIKSDAMRAHEKQTEVGTLLKGLTAERFAELTNMCRGITDYRDAGEQKSRVDSLDDAHGVAVVIDEDDDNEENDYELKDDESDDEDQQDNQAGDNESSATNEPAISSALNNGDSSSNGSSNGQSAKESLNPMDIDAFWIQRKIATFESDPLQAQRLAEQVLDILKQTDVRRCEGDLVALFDFTRFDFIKILLHNKQTILYCTMLAKSENDQERKKIEDEMRAQPLLYTILNKLKGMDDNKEATGGRAAKEQKRTTVPETAGVKTPKRNLNLDDMVHQQGSHLMTNKKFTFPPGSKSEDHKGYKEIHVPAKQNPPFKDGEDLVSIASLPEWARAPFKGFEKLNRVQSRLYDWAFFSNENFLLSAPTSAGKTNVAMLAILHEIGLHIQQDGSIDLDSFKIVYIAPMKSLVQEMVQNFSNRLSSYGITVRELTGDSSLTGRQIAETQVIVTTPEKWDIITRKSGERAYTSLVRLVIIDEIHLLHDERGPVLECIVARTLRTIETTQEMVRLVGLSATLPNYEDVAMFLRVKTEGVFYFDSSYRPIPLEQQYIGVSERGIKQLQATNDITYKKVEERAGQCQVLIFVHSRRETAKTARDIRDRAVEADTIGRLLKRADSREILREEAEKTAKNAELKDLLPYGIGIHHAGLARSDRTLVEELFADQHIQVLVSTATLAWGVNLPAHTVIIKGTQVYNAEKGWSELSPLDVTQMLGRAGRPPYDKEGEGIVITTQHELQFYLSLLNTQLSIESQFISRLSDNLNAEIVLGSVHTVGDAARWLSYTYLYICMLRNPTLYDVSHDEIDADPELEQRRLDLVHAAAVQLERNSLVTYDRKAGRLVPTDLGKVASHYYVTNASMSVYHEHLKPAMSDIELFRLFALSSEFKSVVVREGEKAELERLLERVPIPVKETLEEPAAKINVLLQAYISNLKLDGFALIVDMFYIAQSAARITRALFEIVLKKGWAQLAKKVLHVCRMVERKMWASQSPLRQFKELSGKILNQLERRAIPIEDLYEYNSQQLGSAIQNAAEGKKLHKLIHHFPKLDLTAHVQPILRGLLRVDLTIAPDFEFDERHHDNALVWWVFVEDVDGERILYHEQFTLKKRNATEEQTITFTVQLSEPLPPQYYVRVLSDRWIGADYSLAVSFRHLILPEKYPPCRGLLDLQPMPIESLRDDKAAKSLFPHFRYFNAIQTQVFATVFQGDDNLLLAAPANSGKTVVAELAILRALQKNPAARCVYVAARSEITTLRMREWSYKFGQSLGKRVVELTGEPITDTKLMEGANIVIATAERWDVLSRRWKQRKAVQNIALFIVDELHLVGGGSDGATLEIVCSRMRYIASQVASPIRMVALSAPVANARDLAEWMGATPSTLFNFHPDVRPVPLQIQIQGFDMSSFNTRAAAMSKPALYAVSRNQRGKSIVFVPTRKLARSMARDLIVCVDTEEDTTRRRYLNCDQEELVPHLEQIESVALKQAIQWGVAFYHEGLTPTEKRVVELLFKSGAITVLVATHAVAWALDLYASLVVVAGTQCDAASGHSDYAINDVLQMLGRAGTQGIDSDARCLLLCHAAKKEYYKTFLNEPLPIESHVDHFLADHFNAEIVAKTIGKKQDALDYLTWTFLYRRLTQNPNYYNLTGVSHRHLSEHMSELVENTLGDLEHAHCIAADDEADALAPLNLGIIASYYYLKYTTVELFASSLKATTKRKGILEIVATAPEFATLPMRHREDQILSKMAAHLPLKIEKPDYNDPHTKVNILLQAHFSRRPMSADLHLDLQSVLENTTRLLQAIVDVISSSSWLSPALAAMELSQMCTQAMWDHDPVLKQLPHMTTERLARAKQAGIDNLFDLMSMEDESRDKLLQMTPREMSDVAMVCAKYPDIEVSYNVEDEEDLHSGSAMSVEVLVARDIEDDSIDETLNIVHAPYYPKQKIGGWWVILGDPKNNLVYAIKRLTLTKKAKVKFDFVAPAVGKHMLNLYLVSDSYTGCDQEYEVEINVKPAVIDDDEEEEEDDDQMQE
eukprot:gene7678-8985_t